MAWLWWVGGALLLVIVEMISLDLVLLMFAGGALVAAALAALGAPVWAQILGFAVASTLLLMALRPWLLRHLRMRMPLEETNAAAHLGRLAIAVTEVNERTGRVKLAGEVWTARTENDEVLPTGVEARVLRIAGATAVVTAHRRPDPGHQVTPTAPPSHNLPHDAPDTDGKEPTT
ncbi:membrane protein [Cellulomonas bogoriensis 69B4 = DSM 16987]|uniref:Membrane protein n=2 Tax=Cellulomonas bogoriensis TaxID=301388 RepID=A0A0A0BQX4_9CELL|nr:NfeD family protein [Cellulomonas bogoriensis]KGM10366.1 membrane protein [Cellulomonas bogoriensis 69B4 = DSM 16987]